MGANISREMGLTTLVAILSQRGNKFKGIVQPKKRGVERGTIRTVMTSHTIADVF
jgi:hypothetical protein